MLRSSFSGLDFNASRYATTFFRALSTSITAEANAFSSSLYRVIPPDIASIMADIPEDALLPALSTAFVLPDIAFSIRARAAVSEDMERAIAIIFSLSIPLPIFFISPFMAFPPGCPDGRDATPAFPSSVPEIAVPASTAAAGISSAIPVIMENMSFPRAMAADISRAFTSSSAVIPATRHT